MLCCDVSIFSQYYPFHDACSVFHHGKTVPLKINAPIEEKYYLSPRHIWVGWLRLEFGQDYTLQLEILVAIAAVITAVDA